MPKPDLNEVVSQREHGRLAASTASVMSAVRSLQDFWSKAEAADGERIFGDAVVVRLVTLLEAFSQASVMEFCSWSPEHYLKAIDLGKDAKINWKLLGEVGEERVTAAELLAYTISVGSLSKLISIFEKIISGFGKRLSSARPLWSDQDDGENIIGDTESMLEQIGRLFEARHKVVHEISNIPPYQTREVHGYCEAVAGFMEATSWLIRAETSGPIPKAPQELTYHDMRLGSNEGVQLSIVSHIVKEIEQYEGFDRNLFYKSQKSWKKFCDQHVKFLATLCDDRSKLHEVVTSNRINLCAQRIQQLNSINKTLKSK